MYHVRSKNQRYANSFRFYVYSDKIPLKLSQNDNFSTSQLIKKYVFYCNEQPSQATANPVSGKACSSTKVDLLRYIPNTYSIHKVSSLKFAYFQGRLSLHIISPSEKTRPESWPGDYMGKATPVWQLSLSHRCHQM